MATYENHIEQAKINLSFLQQTNSTKQDFWDWQITISFYVVVHIVNAHIAKVADLHYRTHEDVKNAINPYNTLSLCKLPEDIYLDYAKLEGLSRRARYLCHDDFSIRDERAYFTYDKHFAKAINRLDRILDYFNNIYGLGIKDYEIICSEISTKTPLKIFKIRA